MKNRQVKKIIKKYGRWYPVDFSFTTSPDITKVEYFGFGGWAKKIPWWKLKKFWPYNQTGYEVLSARPYLYCVHL
jgi:hypothetical protein